jgi:metal-responsive CopG/Arc/MetJ family transcriptional regulator
MPHGKSREGICTISAKVEQNLRDELDRIRAKLGLETRSDVVKRALTQYVQRFKNIKTIRTRENNGVYQRKKSI